METRESNVARQKTKGMEHYVPPPLRKSGESEPSGTAKTSQRNLRANLPDKAKLCDNSSLLFQEKDDQPFLLKTSKVRYKRWLSAKKKRINKNVDSEIADNGQTFDGAACPSQTPHSRSENTAAVLPETIQVLSNETDEECTHLEHEHFWENIVNEHETKHDEPTVMSSATPVIDLVDVTFPPGSPEPFASREVMSHASECNGVANGSSLPTDNAILEEPKYFSLDNPKDLKRIQPYKEGEHSNTHDGILNTKHELECQHARSPSPKKDPVSVDENDWESLYDDQGDCLAPNVVLKSLDTSEVRDITQRLGEVKLVKAKSFNTPLSTNNSFLQEEGEVTSILEIYGFSQDMKTNDLVNVFSNYINRGFNLKWVDNTHALAIFPSHILAEEVLSTQLPLVKTRPLSQATPLSQEKARNLVLPSSLRPKTCSALARRLVTGALGLKVQVSPEERAAERALLKEAREKRRLLNQQKNAAWEGKFST